MWIEFDNKLVNLELIESIVIDEYQSGKLIVLNGKKRNYTEDFKNYDSELFQKRHKEIKELLIPKTKVDNKAYLYFCRKCGKEFGTNTLLKYSYCSDCLKELNDLIRG